MAEAPDVSEFPFDSVAPWLLEGDLVPFIGSGASRVGDALPEPVLPDGSGLACELVKKMGRQFPSDGSDDLAKVAQVYEHTVFDRTALYEYLHRRFEADQPEQAVGVVAQLLARLPRASKPMFMMTTNYDSFVERAFKAAKQPLCVITQNMRDPDNGASAVKLTLPDGSTLQEPSAEFQWNDPDRFPPGCAFLFKMHGSVNRRNPAGPDDVIITEDDYVDFMVNAGGSMSPYFPPAALTAQYKTRRFLFLGYSLYDWNFRAFLRMLSRRNALSGRDVRRHFAIQLNPHPLEVELWRHRNVTVYNGDLGEFCVRLLDEIETVSDEESLGRP